MVIKQLNIKSEQFYFYNELINLKDFDPSLIVLEQMESANVYIHYVNYATKHPLYLYIRELDGFIDEKKGNKYLNITLTDSNNDVLVKYAKVWRGIKDKINMMNNSAVGDYGKDYMKIKFDSNDDLLLMKVLKFHILTIVIRHIFEKDNKYYPQIFLGDCLHEI